MISDVEEESTEAPTITEPEGNGDRREKKLEEDPNARIEGEGIWELPTTKIQPGGLTMEDSIDNVPSTTGARLAGAVARVLNDPRATNVAMLLLVMFTMGGAEVVQDGICSL